MLTISALTVSALAQAPRFGPDDIATVFFVSKSSNQNRVDYAVRLDGRCRPRGDAPVFGYWRMLELGSNAFEPLMPRHRRGYGLSEQQVERGPSGGVVRFSLVPLPTRSIVIRTRRQGGACAASAEALIDGRPATLSHAHLVLRRLRVLGVRAIELHGRRDGRGIVERVDP